MMAAEGNTRRELELINGKMTNDKWRRAAYCPKKICHLSSVVYHLSLPENCRLCQDPAYGGCVP